MAQQTDPRILGTEKIGKLLLQYSIPAIIGMTITSLYNIIDSIFIGHGVGAMAISGLAITFPLMNLVVAFCVLISAYIIKYLDIAAFNRSVCCYLYEFDKKCCCPVSMQRSPAIIIHFKR